MGKKLLFKEVIMKKCYISSLFICSMILLITTLSCSNEKSVIKYNSIGWKSPIIGSLEKPLGTLVSVKGTIIKNDKSKADTGVQLLKITRLNKKKLETPIVIRYQTYPWASVTIPSVGSAFSFTGFETGRMAGIPNKAFRYLPRVATRDYHFEVYFQICK